MTTFEKKTVVFTLRISEEILNKVKELARRNKRSSAKQIEFMLENALKEKY